MANKKEITFTEFQKTILDKVLKEIKGILHDYSELFIQFQNEQAIAYTGGNGKESAKEDVAEAIAISLGIEKQLVIDAIKECQKEQEEEENKHT